MRRSTTGSTKRLRHRVVAIDWTIVPNSSVHSKSVIFVIACACAVADLVALIHSSMGDRYLGGSLPGVPKVRPLTGVEARRTLAHRFGGIADRLRQLATNFGIRSRRCFLTWVRSTGEARGEGLEGVVERVEILPTPRVGDLTSLSLNPFSAGVLPIGSVRVDRISIAYTLDQLEGRLIPGQSRQVGAPNLDFFWEIVEDGRGDQPAERQRFRVLGRPHRDEGGVQWIVLLERMAEDLDRRGRPQPDLDP